MNKADRKLFTKRPKRTETCSHCRGHGRVEVSYALAPGLPIEGAPSNALFASVVGASSIFEACREAVELAQFAHRPVVFEFNEQIVVARGDVSGDKLARAWWQKAYNETPEQSAARR